MVLIEDRAGRRRSARKWLKVADQYVAGLNEWLSQYASTIHTAVARYVWAARCALDPGAGPADMDQVASVAWYLWDRGHRVAATRYARHWLGRPPDIFLAGRTGQIIQAEDYLRDTQLLPAVQACLAALVAMGAVTDGDQGLRTEAIAAIDLQAIRAMPSLTLAERAEYYARVAIGLHRAGEPTALGMLEMATESAKSLARRGELGSFQRLCQAAAELLPPNEAVLLWAQWLQAAAQSDAYDALGMIASYLRCLSTADLAGIKVDPETGDLKSSPA